MKKLIKLLCLCMTFICLAVWTMIIYAIETTPDEINISADNLLRMAAPYSIDLSSFESAGISASQGDKTRKSGYTADYDGSAQISLMNVFPVKNTAVTVSQRKYVVVSGTVYGIKLFTNGVVIVRVDGVTTESGNVNPGMNAGLEVGDVIMSINGISVSRNTDVSRAFANSDGKAVRIVFRRADSEYKTDLTPARAASDGKFKAGLWVRDSSAGIGTMTFYDPESGVFAGLGHAICDVDTGKILKISGGEIVEADVTGCYKGKDGAPGELCGVFKNRKSGNLIVNSSTGLYGEMTAIPPENGKTVAVAMRYEVKEGKAQIIAEVDSKGPKYYDVEIVKINSDGNAGEKNMVIKITDAALIDATGGIVQGMSGSPIIQNDMLVGAVTHVFVNDSEQGYAIFAEKMMKTADKTAMEIEKAS